MAIPATAVWECRANASNIGLQGGFYNPELGGTDYSQQDTAQLDLSDGATDGAGTGLSSATGGFTAAMVGNGVYLTGGGTTAGWYEIVAYVDGNNVTIDRSAGASKTGVTTRIGGATHLDAGIHAVVEDGNIVYIAADGTHVLTGNKPWGNAASALPIFIKGYGSVHGDNPTENSRPLITCGASYMLFGTYYRIQNLRFTGTAADIATVDSHGVFQNCYSHNSSGTASRSALRNTGSYARFIACEAVSSAGYGFEIDNAGAALIGCYAHDCGEVGFEATGQSNLTMVRCIAATCVIGFVRGNAISTVVIGSVFYGNTTAGIQVTSTGNALVVLNTIFSGNGVGITITDGYEGTVFEDYNDFYGNTTDKENIPVGANSLTVDPQFTDAANGDFSIGNTDLKNAATPSTFPGGFMTNYEDIGIQAQPASSGVGCTAYISVG